ncbi:unnamed protein product [Fusarium graminearum]|nr:unnamed protein product [Fusarium graminearum]
MHLAQTVEQAIGWLNHGRATAIFFGDIVISLDSFYPQARDALKDTLPSSLSSARHGDDPARCAYRVPTTSCIGFPRLWHDKAIIYNSEEALCALDDKIYHRPES